MPQSDGYTTIKRMAIEVAGQTFRFKINPQDYQFNMPQRSTTTRTKSRNVIQDFGRDVGTIVMSGTTGWRKLGDGKSGAERIKELQSIIETYNNKNSGSGNAPNVEMTFHNYTDDYSFVVHPMQEGLTIKRNAERPILFDYTIALYAVRDAKLPPDANVHDPEIGNKEPSIGGGSGSKPGGGSGSSSGTGSGTNHGGGTGSFKPEHGGGTGSFKPEHGGGSGSFGPESDVITGAEQYRPLDKYANSRVDYSLGGGANYDRVIPGGDYTIGGGGGGIYLPSNNGAYGKITGPGTGADGAVLPRGTRNGFLLGIEELRTQLGVYQ